MAWERREGPDYTRDPSVAARARTPTRPRAQHAWRLVPPLRWLAACRYRVHLRPAQLHTSVRSPSAARKTRISGHAHIPRSSASADASVGRKSESALPSTAALCIRLAGPGHVCGRHANQLPHFPLHKPALIPRPLSYAPSSSLTRLTTATPHSRGNQHQPQQRRPKDPTAAVCAA